MSTVRPLKKAAGDIKLFAEKTAPVDNDILLIEDSADYYNKKKVKISNLPAGPAHHTTHEDSGSDEISVAGLSGWPVDVDNRVMIRAYGTTDQLNIVDGVWTKVSLNAETYDPGGWFDSTTNYRFTAPVSGYYKITGQVFWYAIVAARAYRAQIYINGIGKTLAVIHSGASGRIACLIEDTRYLNAGDYVELWANHSAGENTPDIEADENITYLAIHLLSKG